MRSSRPPRFAGRRLNAGVRRLMDSVMYYLFPVWGIAIHGAVVLAAGLLYRTFRHISLLTLGIGGCLSLASWVMQLFYSREVTFDEKGQVLSESLPPDWAVQLGGAIGWAGLTIVGVSLLVFAWQTKR